MMRISDIKNGVSKLPLEEQAALACWIISNLDASAQPSESIDTAWRQEVRSRVEAIKSGCVEMIPGAKMWEDLMSGYGKAGRISSRG